MEEETLKKIRTKVLGMLARREHSRAELQEKTLIWLVKQREADAQSAISRTSSDYIPTQNEINVVEKILDEFEDKSLQSDERFIESFINQRSQRLGQHRVKQELRQKGLSEDLVQEALDGLSDTEYERAAGVWARKFKTTPQDQKEYAQQMRFMLYRGFSADVVNKILSKQEI